MIYLPALNPEGEEEELMVLLGPKIHSSMISTDKGYSSK